MGNLDLAVLVLKEVTVTAVEHPGFTGAQGYGMMPALYSQASGLNADEVYLILVKRIKQP